MTTEPSPSGGTASNMAAFRALETCKPESVRLFADPYAVRFLPLWQRGFVMAARVPGLRPVIERYAHGLVPGAGTSAVARTRLIDDWLREEIGAGARQVVILGAGFDCRALRLLELESIDVFELDRVAMVAFKNRKLEDVARNNVRRIAVDFLRDSLVDRLAAAGFARGKRTAFVWEGVTNYLDERSISAVFGFVTSAAPAGSKIAFTYVHADAITGRFEARGLAPLLESLKKRGEPWTFGFRPEELGPIWNGTACAFCTIWAPTSIVHSFGRRSRRALATSSTTPHWPRSQAVPRVKPEHKATRRAQILDAARACFARQGFHRTTLQDVFAEAGLSAGCVYSYFRSKDDLILAIAEERHVSERAILTCTAAAQDPVEALRSLARSFAGEYLSAAGSEKRQIAIQTWSEALLSRAIMASVREGLDDPREAIAALVRPAQANGQIDRKLDADAVARSMIALFHGSLLQMLWDPELDRDAGLEVFDRFVTSLQTSPRGRLRVVRKKA